MTMVYAILPYFSTFIIIIYEIIDITKYIKSEFPASRSTRTKLPRLIAAHKMINLYCGTPPEKIQFTINQYLLFKTIPFSGLLQTYGFHFKYYEIQFQTNVNRIQFHEIEYHTIEIQFQSFGIQFQTIDIQFHTKDVQF